jgi:hypothetical protein
MTNDEGRRNDETRIPGLNSAAEDSTPVALSSFEHSDFLRPSSFVLRHFGGFLLANFRVNR